MVHIVIDNSNIFFTAKNFILPNRPGYTLGMERRFRLSPMSLIDFLAAGRQVATCFVAGSNAPGRGQFWQEYRDAGAVVEIHQRNELGEETTVDSALQAKVHHVIDAQRTPGTILLVTGDGNGLKEDKGFVATLKAVKRRGWTIEVASWDYGCNRQLRQYATQFGRYRSLDPVFDQVTLIAPAPTRTFPTNPAIPTALPVPPDEALSPFSLAARLTPATLAAADSLRRSAKTPSMPQYSPAKSGARS